MKKRVTKISVMELATIIKNNGYWCKEVNDYLSKYDYNAMQVLNSKAKFLAKQL